MRTKPAVALLLLTAIIAYYIVFTLSIPSVSIYWPLAAPGIIMYCVAAYLIIAEEEQPVAMTSAKTPKAVPR